MFRNTAAKRLLGCIHMFSASAIVKMIDIKLVMRESRKDRNS